MNGAAYWSFVVFAVVLIIAPGPDFAVVVRNSLAGGRVRGAWCALGVATSNVIQGTAAAAGLGILIVRIEPLMVTIRWAGIAYLVLLAAQAIRSALHGRYPILTEDQDRRGGALRGWRQGFLSNITNPKVLVFYLAVLPQFLSPSAGIPVLMLFALTHAVLGLAWSLGLVAFLHGARTMLGRRSVRRGMDAVTGVALLGFGTKLAFERT